MVNVIKPKRGDSDPGTDDIADGEIAIRKDVNPPKLFVRVGSNIREIGAGEANQTLTTGSGISGANSGSDGNFTIAVEAAQTTVTSMFATDLKIGEDDQTKIDFETADEIQVYLNNAKDFTFSANTFTALSGSSIVVPAGGLTIGSTAVSSTAAELNILDGVTSTAAELNIMDGVTATAAEINLIDGGTSRGTTAVASGDGFLHNDGGVMRMTNVSKLADRLAGSGLSNSDGVLAVGTLNQNTTGSAATLTTARNIAGVSFNGSADISLNNNAITNGAGYTTNTGDVTLSGAQTFTGAKTFQTDTKLLFRDSGLFINSSADGTLKISSDDELSLEADDNVQVRVKDTFVVRENTDDDIFMRVHPDNQTLELRHEDSATNQFKILVEANGATTLSTADSDGAAGHLVMDVDGNITLDADAGTITFSDAGSSLGTITSSGYSGTAATATALASARTIGGVSFDGTGNINLPGVNTGGNQDTSGTATNATHVTLTDNESTNENNKITFVEGAEATGNRGLETDGDFHYNPSTGTVTATIFKGNIDAVDGDFDGTMEADAISIGGTAITSTAAELNILDGVTSTAAELNVLDGFAGATADLTYAKDLRATGVTTTEFDKLDGLTASTAELNIMDGVTSTTAELNIMDGVTSTTAELNKLDGYTGSVTELNYLDTLHATGVTATEFDYLDGVTSNIQTQIDNAGGGSTGNISFSDTTMAGNAMTLDSAGEIALDADDNGEVKFFDGGAHYATMQKNSTQGLKLTAGSESKVILTTEDTGILATTGHQWIQAHHFGISNLDNNTPVFISWTSSNSNQSDIANHRPLMPCAGRILKCLITCRNSNSNALATMTNGGNDFEMEMSGSSTFSDVGHGAGVLKIADPGRVFENTGNYPVNLSPLQTAVDDGSAGIDATLLGYTWAAGDTIVGKIKNHSGNSNQRASMTMLVEWTV